MNMIEIEVEMEIELPGAELVGIEQQMARLEELEGLQDDWRVQAEARDEVSEGCRPRIGEDVWQECKIMILHSFIIFYMQVEKLLKSAS